MPATKIIPLVKPDYTFDNENLIKYKYKVRNVTDTEQSITGFHFEGVNVGSGVMAAPSGWFAISAKISSSSYSTGWLAVGKESVSEDKSDDKDDSEIGILPGKTEGGFGFSVKFLPGVLNFKLSGSAPILAFPDEGPTGEIGKQLEKLERVNSVGVPVAAPLISIQSTNSQIIEMLNSHLVDLNNEGYLSQELKNSLSDLLVIAKNSIDLDDIRSAKTALENALHLLKKEQKGLEESEWSMKDKKSVTGVRPEILKLAARALKFHIKYVIDQLEE